MRKQYIHTLLGIFIIQVLLGIVFAILFFISSLFSAVLSWSPLLLNVFLAFSSIEVSVISIILFRYLIPYLLPKTELTIKQFVLLCSAYFTLITIVFYSLYLFPDSITTSFFALLFQPSLKFFQTIALSMPCASDKTTIVFVNIGILIENIFKVIALGIGYSKLLNETAFENSIKNNETKAQTDNTKLLNNDLETKNNISISND